jgi:hypothetical protein
MNFDPNNFLTGVKQLTTGNNLGTADDGGFFKDDDVTPQFTNTTVTTTSTGVGVFTSVVATSTATFTSTGASTFGPFFIPRDYDLETDMLQFRFLGSTAGTGSSTIAVIGTISVFSTGGTAAVVSSPTIASTVFQNGVWNSFGISFQGVGLQYTDAVSLTLSTSGGNVRIAAAALVIESDLVAYADYNGPGNPNNSNNVGASFGFGPGVGGGGPAVEMVGTSTQLIRYQ